MLSLSRLSGCAEFVQVVLGLSRLCAVCPGCIEFV